MRISYRGFAEGVLFALNILLVFLLAFEDFIIMPLWLQPFGRMHPMLLHFPIALLFLAMVLEFFRFKPEFDSEGIYEGFISNLFLFSVITASVTALMGLFLSLEEGYAGDVLIWHKWSGAGIVFFSSLIYGFRNKKWYDSKIAKTGAVITCITLTLAGHFGATLTHGDDFILGPILQAKTVNVPIEEAVVFDHLVMPVLEKKCNSCHNQRKAKGELILTDIESIKRGGKSGILFEHGKPDQSLLVEKIFLPLEDEEHMPPSGKPQLTLDEKQLLHLWVKENADFEAKVTSLPLDDSLRVLASTMLNPSPKENPYDFPTADPDLIRNLNNEYRVVTPLAKSSPALDVNFFNHNAFTENSLQELLALKEQIVSLNLSKMPVTDQELKTISQFENLGKLNLNFTQVTAQGLAELHKLKKLKHLSLAGTKLNFPGIQNQIKDFSTVQSITVWNTELKDAEIEQLKNENKQIKFIAGREGAGENKMKLNLPMLKNENNIFKDSLQLLLGHPIKDVEIRYTMDGSEPDSINSPVFIAGETTIKESKVIQAKAFKEGWYGSEKATFTIYQNKYPPDTVMLQTKLNRVHPANGAQTFFDGELGGFNANSPAWANNWAGFSSEDMELLLEYNNAVTVSSISLNILVEPETVIFPPASIEIWGGDSETDLKLIGQMKPDQPLTETKPYIQLINCKVDPSTATYFKVVAKPLKKLPTWHRNKGRPSLLLIDEMFIN